jgi:CheY-like chemotaxis protein
VEDNPVNQRVTLAMLEHLGFCVDVVDNGVEAVVVAAMVPYRAILMDCQIPTLNGYDTASEIRRLWGASRNSPIIAVTSVATESEQEAGIAVGMSGFLMKPLTLDTLSAGLARWAPDPSGDANVVDTSAINSESDSRPGKDRPVLDPEIVERLERLGVAAGEDLMGELASVFLTEAGIQVVELMHLAHSLCGSSANLGAAELARLCARLTTDGAVVDSISRDLMMSEIEDELEQVRIALTPRKPSSFTRERSAS